MNLNHVRRVDKDTYSFIMLNEDRVDIRQKDRLKDYEDALELWVMEKTGRGEV